MAPTPSSNARSLARWNLAFETDLKATVGRNLGRREFCDEVHGRMLVVWKKRGWSVDVVARESGLPVAQIQRYCDGPLPARGKWRLDASTLLAIASGLNCTVDFLLGRDKTPGSWRIQAERGNLAVRKLLRAEALARKQAKEKVAATARQKSRKRGQVSP